LEKKKKQCHINVQCIVGFKSAYWGSGSHSVTNHKFGSSVHKASVFAVEGNIQGTLGIFTSTG
jgi:hypothetical protein